MSEYDAHPVGEPLLECASHFEDALNMGDLMGQTAALAEMKNLLTDGPGRARGSADRTGGAYWDVGVLSMVHATFSRALCSARASKDIMRSCAFVLDVIRSVMPGVPEDDVVDGRSSSAFTESSIRQLSQRFNNPERTAVCNFLAAKRPHGIAPAALPLAAGLLDVPRAFEYAPPPPPEAAAAASASSGLEERVRSVALERKREELERYRESGQRTVRRKGSRLFQYVFYRHQKPLKIDEPEVRRVVEAVLEPPKGEPQARVTASKILIKIMMDLYKGALEGLPGAVQPGGEDALLLSLFLDALASREPDTRAHAFTLLFNLSVHALMWDEPPDDALGGEGAPALDETLHRYLCEMLLCVLQSDERDDRVWSAALTCALHFLTHDGRFVLRRLEAVDVRVLAALVARVPALCLPRGSWAGLAGGDLIHRRLVEALANRLYRPGSAEGEWTLNEEALEDAGGVAALGEQLAGARCASARHNLFVLLLDALFVAASRARPRPFPPEQGGLMAELLWRVGGPDAFARLFRLPHERFPEACLAFLAGPGVPKGGELAAIAEYTSREAVSAVLHGALRAALALNRVPEELHEVGAGLPAAQQRARRATVVTALASSSLPSDRRNVTAWLVELLRPLYGRRDQPPGLVSEAEAESLLAALAASRAPESRRVYVAVVERLAISLVYAGRAEAVGRLLDAALGRLVARGERDEATLMASMDAIASFLLRPAPSPLPEAAGLGGADTAYAALLEGRAGVCGALLAELDARLLLHLAANLSPRSSPDPRAAALALLLRKCRAQPEALPAVGGPGRLFALLDAERDPRSLLLLSEFLLEACREEVPAGPRLAHALRAAREAGDPGLLSNPYLQARALLQSEHGPHP